MTVKLNKKQPEPAKIGVGAVFVVGALIAIGSCTANLLGSSDLPNAVGDELQHAQDAAQAAGYYNLSSRDATGQGRMQVWDRNWKVCSQTPGPGEHDEDTLVTFRVVLNEETCP